MDDRYVTLEDMESESEPYEEAPCTEARRRLSDAKRELERALHRERRIAETLQRNFLPESTMSIDGYHLASAYYPALEEAAIGGDMYDMFRLPDGRIGIAIADVSGKGLLAARYGAMIKYMIRAYSRVTDDPAEVMRLLNDSVADEVGSDTFVTCFFGLLDPSTHTLLYSNAGHEEPLYVQRANGTVERLLVNGPALGPIPKSTYEQGRVDLCHGDMIFLYTDGVTDARGAETNLGTPGLEEYVATNCALSADSIVECVLNEVKRRSGDRLADDVAMLALEVVDNEHRCASYPN